MSRNGKVLDLEELAAAVERKRATKTVVMCHGVFDLLHVGHIRHLREARKLGDILVVTITPDRFVNKGPHRPAFSETLRAEALAALDCVDFVAINRWSMAVEAIKVVRPDVYVKGADYRDASSDMTGGISLEAAAVESVGGRIAFTDEITFSSTSLLNRFLPAFPQDVSDFLADFARRHSIDEIRGYVERAQALKVLVVGETIIDEYRYCEAIGKSAKEPMLVVKGLSTEKFAGGILAVANNAASFAGQVGVLSFLGSEHSQEEFIRRHLAGNVEGFFLERANSPTIVKQRFIESYFFTKLLEVDTINDELLSREDEAKLCAELRARLPDYDLVIVVDFGHAMLTPAAIEILCSEARYLAVNAQSNGGNLGYHAISRYPRVDFACMAEHELRLEARDRRGDLSGMIVSVAERLGARRLVVTRGNKGCTGYDPASGFIELPALAAQVVDRMGAGDTFLSVAALCMVQDAPLDVACFIGNVAGAEAVATVGHRRTIERLPLLRHIESLMK